MKSRLVNILLVPVFAIYLAIFTFSNSHASLVDGIPVGLNATGVEVSYPNACNLLFISSGAVPGIGSYSEWGNDCSSLTYTRNNEVFGLISNTRNSTGEPNDQQIEIFSPNGSITNFSLPDSSLSGSNIQLAWDGISSLSERVCFTYPGANSKPYWEGLLRKGFSDHRLQFGRLTASSSVASDGCPAPESQEIEVSFDLGLQGGEVLIPNGSTITSVSNHTDMGITSLGSPTSRTYLVREVDYGTDLTLTSLSISDNVNFSLGPVPAGGLIVGAGRVRLIEPTCNAVALGTFTATVVIGNDDPDDNENPYTFNVKCEVANFPEIEVTGNGNQVPDGSSITSAANNTDFGTGHISDDLSGTFTISEVDGIQPLQITGINVSGSDFLVSPLPAGGLTIPAGGSEDFEVTCNSQDSYYGIPVEATVTIISNDIDDNETTYSFKVKCQAFNIVPIADAGPDKTVPAGSTVTLDGSGSIDPDGDTINYIWHQGGAGLYPALTDNNTVNPTFVAPLLTGNTPVTLTFRVHTFDDYFPVGTFDTVEITVVPNQAPIANAGPDQNVNETSIVTLNGGGSSDPDTDPLTYAWTQTTGPTVALSSATASNPTFTTPTLPLNAPVTLIFDLLVNDGTVNSATADTVEIVVTNVNEAPISNAGADQTVDETTPVILTGLASSDPDSDPLTYVWTQTAGPTVSL